MNSYSKKTTSGKAHSLIKNLANNSLLVLVSLVVALFLAEFLTRAIAPQKLYRFPKGMFVSHPTLQYRLAPNFDGILNTVEYTTAIHTNNAGLREDREYTDTALPGIYRILAIGDSFTMGVGVESDETFVRLVEKILNESGKNKRFEIVNSGVPGYNTRQELGYLVEDGLQLNPDLILVGFFVGNDIVDNYLDPRTIVSDGYLRSGPPAEGFLPPALRDFLGRNSHLYNFLWPYQRRLLDRHAVDEEIRKQRQYLSIYSTRKGPETAAMWAVNRKLLQRLADIAKDHSTAVAVVIIPDQYQIDRDNWTTIIENTGDDISDYEREKPGREIARICSTLGIPALNLLPKLALQAAEEPLYLTLDGHWTVYGNRKAAQVIAEFLEKQLVTEN